MVAQGGAWVFKHYPTLRDALSAVYPSQEWERSRFYDSSSTGRLRKGYWLLDGHINSAIERAERTYGITKAEDWYSITLSDLKAVGFASRINREKLLGMLKKRYPSHSWDPHALLRGKYSQQKKLEKALSTLFPNEVLSINARKDPALINPETGQAMEVDIYLPSLQLGFEYQEKHHYTTSGLRFPPLEVVQKRDTLKRELAAQKGITLIVIPCWWDGKMSSLKATIKKHRPDISFPPPSSSSSDFLESPSSSEDEEAIPDEPPSNFFQEKAFPIPDIGEPINACFLTQSHVDPTNWWIFEKYDGVRGFWNPLKKTFYSRHGKAIAFPQEIIDAMPTDIFLDGELWFGENNFQEALRLSTKAEASRVDWTSFKFMVFDLPLHKGNYAERYQALEEYMRHNDTKWIKLAEKVVCTGMNHLETLFQEIIAKGGEGIILRDPSSPYQPGRSQGYLKHKKFRDAEAKIVGFLSDSLWECELPNGVRFKALADKNFAKKFNPKVDDIVSFKHRGFLLNSKRPKLPILYRIRKDITWEDLVHTTNQKTNVTVPPIRKRGMMGKDKYWDNVNICREFFNAFAKDKGFDPMDPNTWYKVPIAELKLREGGNGMRARHGSFKRALQFAYPEIAFTKWQQMSNKWKDPLTCRKVFDEFAAQEGKNPLDPDTWYTLRLKKLLKQKGARSIQAFNDGFRKAIQMAYPEIDFKRWA